jgi:hypothetical protein
MTAKGGRMKRLLVVGLAVGCMGTSGMVIQGIRASQQSPSIDVQASNDGAFRDGLYLGKLARAANMPMHPPVGRWSTDKDRASFVRGYRQGFGVSLAE